MNFQSKLDRILNEGRIICPKCRKPSPEKREKCIWCGRQLKAPAKSSLAVTIDDIVAVANKYKGKQLKDLIKIIESELIEEAKSWKKEEGELGALTDINTVLMKTEPTHNLYKAYIPISHKKRITLYTVRDKVEGMDDQQLEALLVKQLEKKMQLYKELVAAGDEDAAKKVLIDDMIVGEKEALTKFHSITKREPSTVTSKSDIKVKKALSKATITHARSLLKAGLYPKLVANMKLHLKSSNDISSFSSNFIEKAATKLPQWGELLKAKNVTPDEIAKNLKNATVTDELVKFLITNNGMSVDSISKGAARSIAAASLISAAALLAADQKLAEARS